jgi:DMSO/TMAO reductase YedYZ molybdopterin-dependent catalytic subunit
MNLSRRDWFRMAVFSAATPAFSFDGPRPPKPGMIVRAVRPEDLEMPLDGFQSYITPIERFFVRTHDYEPTVKIESWRLRVDGQVRNPLTLTLDELKRMPKVDLTGVLECAGNGRGLYQPSMAGLQWTYGGVGNGRWAGVRLADVLKRAGLNESAKELLFDGADSPMGTMPKFQRTITVKKGLDPNTLLAYEMNGQVLPAQHGYPLRLIASGWAGDSWVKWVTRIQVLDHEFDGFFMKTAYRHPGKPVRPGEAVDPAQMQPVTTLRAKSVIATPVDGAQVVVGKPLRIAGAAWAGDKGPVSGVDVSTDRGRTWRAAKLGTERSEFGWRLWNYEFTPQKAEYYGIMARARTAAGDVQPFVEEWNPSGYQWNVVQSVGVGVSDKPGQPAPHGTPPPNSTAAEYPAGYKQGCLVCHGEDVIQQQKLNRAQWDKEVDKMIRWGAQVKPEERSRILDYLTRFGPAR